MTPAFGPSEHLVPPLYPAAVYALPDLDALDAVYATGDGFTYARDGHPNALQLTTALNALEAATWGVVTAAGMGAIVAGLVPHLRAGDRVVASSQLYGRTVKLLRDELARFGVVTAAGMGAIVAGLVPHLKAGDRVVASSQLYGRTVKLLRDEALAAIAHRHSALLLVDNTFATPAVCRPLACGADLVMESVTKLIGGHSDVMLGYLGGRDARHADATTAAVSTWGLTARPFDCWLTLRGLETFHLRVDAACRNAVTVADWLSQQPGVSRVIYPGRPGHPDHAVARALFGDRFGHMLGFELPGGREAVNRFLQAAPGVPFCPSLGHTGTTCSHPDTTSHRFETPAAKQALGITPGLIRLSVGCEPPPAILAEIGRGLAAT